MRPAELPSRALVVGGLGFIGSALSLRLARAGVETTALDLLIEEGGGLERHALELERAGARVVRGDARDVELVSRCAEGRGAVFNLAGRTGHLDSVRDPHGDLEHNLRSALSVLEACRRAAPEAPLVYASTRQVYGRARALPVDETHPLAPLDPNGVHKAAAEQEHAVYAAMHGLKTVCLRLSNVYGPRMRVRDDRQNFVGAWLGRLLRGEELPVFGDGSPRRDLVFVEDAVDAFLAAAASPAAYGRSLNVGGGEPVSLRALAETLAGLPPGGRWKLLPFPERRRAIDVGDSWCDVSLARTLTGWSPRTPLRDGLERTLEFYRQHAQDYGAAAGPVPGPVEAGRVAAA